ncbi:hypothetical protein ACFL1S_03875 [Pseudomonadota bacterium]
MNKTINQSKLLSITALVAVAWLWLPTAAAQAVPEPESDKWNYLVAPYLWATAIDGTVGTRGGQTEVDASFSDLIDVLDVAFALRFEAQKGQWGYFLDGFYAKLEADTPTQAGNVRVENKMRIFEGGGIYEINPKVQALFGLRTQGIDVDIDFPGLGSASGDEDWVDGFVGLRFIPVRGEKWFLSLRGDIGAGDSDSVLNGVISAGYRFNKTWSLIGAYRVMSTDYSEGDFKWDIDMSGLGLALGISF